MKITIKQKLLFLQFLSLVCAPTVHAWGGQEVADVLKAAASVVGQKAYQVAKGTMDTAFNGGKYVYGNVANVAKASGRYVYNKARYTVDTFGPNIDHELEKPLEKALQAIDFLAQKDPLFKQLHENNEFKMKYEKDEELVHALQVMITAHKKTITVEDIQKSLKSYESVLRLLEHPIVLSYAENNMNNSLKSLLEGYDNGITQNTVAVHIKECKEAVHKRFTEWKLAKEQQLMSFKSEKHTDAEKAQKETEIEIACALYDRCMEQISKAFILYGKYFIIVKKLQLLLRTATDKPFALIFAHVVKKNIEDACKIYSDEVKELESNALYVRIKQIPLEELENSPVLILESARGKKSTAADIQNKVATLADLFKEISGAVTAIKEVITARGNYVRKNDIALLEELVEQYEKIEKYQDIIALLQADPNTINNFVNKKAVIQSYKPTMHTKVSEFVGVAVEDLTIERSKGIAELYKKFNGSISDMIRTAEKEKATYQKRKELRNAFLKKMVANNVYKTFEECMQKLVDLVVNGDAQSIESFANCLTEYEAAYAEVIAEDNLTMTTQDKERVLEILAEVIQDLQNSVNALIVAEWTVVGVKAKMAFEGLQKNEESSPAAVAKRVIGTVLNSARRAVVAVEKEIKHDNYHATTRKAIKKDLKKAGTSAAQKAEEAKTAIEVNAPQVGKAIVEGAQKISEVVVENAPKIGSAIAEAAQKAGDAIKENAPAVKAKIGDVIDSAKEEITETGIHLAYEAQKMGEKLQSVFAEAKGKLDEGIIHAKEWINEKRGKARGIPMGAKLGDASEYDDDEALVDVSDQIYPKKVPQQLHFNQDIVIPEDQLNLLGQNEGSFSDDMLVAAYPYDTDNEDE